MWVRYNIISLKQDTMYPTKLLMETSSYKNRIGNIHSVSGETIYV